MTNYLRMTSRIVGIVTVIVSVALDVASAANLPALPQVYVNTDYVAPTGSVIRVAAGGDFQAALNSAKLGDTIVLDAGAVYVGPFTLPNKTTGSGWIYVTSSNYSRLPSPGTRVAVSDAVNMPILEIGISGESAIATDNNAHHYRFVGVEFRPKAGQYINAIISIGGSDTSLSTMPTDIVFDRCYIHGDPNVATRRGVAMNGIRVSVIDSYVSNFKEEGADTQAVWAYNTPGPLKIVNNYLEAAGENLMIGGAEPRIQGLVPADIEIRDNYFFKPLSWVGGKWVIKNLIEFKLGVRVLISHNVFQNNWASGQQGFAVQLTPRDEWGTAPWSVTKDLTFVSNLFLNAGSGFNISGEDTTYPSQRTERVLIKNNVIEANAFGGAAGRVFQIINGPVDLTIENNTAFAVQDLILSETSTPSLRFVFQNNISTHGRYGVFGTGTGVGLDTLNKQFTDWSMTKNAIIGAQAAGVNTSSYPPGNFFPVDIAAVQFVDVAAKNFRLADTSPYRNAGTDGRDLGVDVATLPVLGSVVASTPTAPKAPTPPTAVTVQ